jgi:hypothetical protein
MSAGVSSPNCGQQHQGLQSLTRGETAYTLGCTHMHPEDFVWKGNRVQRTIGITDIYFNGEKLGLEKADEAKDYFKTRVASVNNRRVEAHRKLLPKEDLAFQQRDWVVGPVAGLVGILAVIGSKFIHLAARAIGKECKAVKNRSWSHLAESVLALIPIVGTCLLRWQHGRVVADNKQEAERIDTEFNTVYQLFRQKYPQVKFWRDGSEPIQDFKGWADI